jgi:CDGSH-type Zn-finger protein
MTSEKKNAPCVMKMEPGTYAWCACGKSTKHPFCDGTHKCSGIHPIIENIVEEKTVAWCGCGASGKKPYCDGTHKTL